MALLPVLLDYDIRPRRFQNDAYGLASVLEDLMPEILDRSRYCRPWRNLSSLSRDGSSTIKSDKDKFQVNLDVQHFSPEEVSVKIVDNYIVVEGNHKEKKDEYGYISRQFKRRYLIPDSCNPEMVESKLSSEGVLTISAPKKSDDKGGRIVPITQTGPVRRKIHDTCDIQANDEIEVKTPQKKRRR